MKTKRSFGGRHIALLLGISMLGLTACSEEEGRADVNYSAPAQVSEVASQPGPGEVYLSWTIPSSPSFMYTKVAYKNSKGEDTYKLFSKDRADENGVMHETISGFASTDPVEFSLYACAVKGASADAVKYSAAPGAPAFIAVAQSVDAAPEWGGVSVSYKNETVADVIISIDYSLKSDPEKKGEVKFTANGNSTASSFVALNVSDSEFINGEEAVLSITAQDADGNSSEPIKKEVRVKKVAAIDRTNWTFPGFADNYDPQIGYSSQEAGGEGGYPRGRVMAMIDGDDNTFWHTAWKQSSSYPHFFIVDMGEEVEVANVSLRRRTGNNGTNTGQTFYTCTEANASGADPSEWNWTNQGWYAFDRNSDKTQVYGMPALEKARYIKVYYAESDKGGNFVMVSEFNAYTPAE